MTLSTEILEQFFGKFVNFVSIKDKKEFSEFKTSLYIHTVENYKYSVYDEARERLGQKRWKPEDIGTGKIQQDVSSAIKTRVNHDFQMVDNNLVDWRKKDDFDKIGKNKALENTLFNFYKSKISNQLAFETLIDEKLSYQFIAYLFFIKDRNQFMPISQTKFDEIFELIGVVDFKTSHNLSWENYSTYISIIKQTREFLKTKDKNVTLLDAHSFLWIIGNQMKNVVELTTTQSKNIRENVQIEKDIFPKEPELIEELIETDLIDDVIYPEEISEEYTEELFEGIKKTITVNAYERNSKARQLCIKHWKAICAVCSFDFEKTYGEIGKGFIHVHHLKPVSKIGKAYQVDPIIDLIPVCPNCHSMLHKQEPPLTINELKSLLTNNE